MVKFEGTYQFVKAENWEEYLIAFGVPPENVAKAVANKSNMVVTYNGTTFGVDFGDHKFNWEKNKETVEEREDTVVTVRTMLEADTLTVLSKSSKDGMTWGRSLKFSDKGLLVTHTCSKTGNIIARREYKRI